MTTIADPAGGRCAIRNTCAAFLDPRTGDFVEALIDNAQDIDEYAFALGALGHYTADNYGHPMAVNRTVPLMYPKLKTEFGNSVIYAQSPKSHVLVEFSFDVEMTKVAWSKKRNEIMKVAPGTQRKTFVFNLRRKDYDKEFGADYAKPHGFARFLGVVCRIAPKIGPFRSLGFSVPTAEAERLFLASFTETRERFHVTLDATSARRLRLPNADFDTGRPTTRGEYSLADTTYDELLDKLATRGFAGIPVALRATLLGYYGAADPLPGKAPDEEKRSARIRLQLASLTATQTSSIDRAGPRDDAGIDDPACARYRLKGQCVAGDVDQDE